MPSRLLHRILHSLRGLLRVCIIAAIMLIVGRVMERLLQPETFAHLANVQSDAMGAVRSISPLQFKDRYLCALSPSAGAMNRELRARGRGSPMAVLESADDAHDCKYAPSGAAVVGHWADGVGIVGPFVALVDTAWHLIVQPSFFASVFVISAFVIAALIVGLVMAQVHVTWHPFVWPTVFAIGTIALACAVAWCLQVTMEGGLYLFGRVTSIAGLCCGAAGIAGSSYLFFLKTLEVQIHESVDRIVPH